MQSLYKSLYIIFYYCIVFISTQDICNSEVIVSQFTFLGCQAGQPGQNKRGLAVLKDYTFTLKSFTLLGWYNFKGNQDQDYLIMQAKNNDNDNIIALMINPVEMVIKSKIFEIYDSSKNNNLNINYLDSLRNIWFFLRVGVNLNVSTNDYNISYIFFIEDTQTSFSVNTTPLKNEFTGASPFLSFNNQQFQLFYGQEANYPYTASCSYSKQILLILENSPSSVNSQVTPQEMQFISQQVIHLNFQLLSKKYGYSLNQAAGELGFHINPLQTAGNPQIDVSCENQFISGPFDFEEKGGLLIQVYFKTNDGLTNIKLPIFQIFKKTTSSPFKEIIYQIGVDKIVGSGQHALQEGFMGGVGLPTLANLIQNQWNTLTIELSINMKYIIRRLFLNNNELGTLRGMPRSQIGQVYFLALNERIDPTIVCDRTVSIKVLRIFQGQFYVPCSLCQIQITPNKDCGLCKIPNNQVLTSQVMACSNTSATQCAEYGLFAVQAQLYTCDFTANTECAQIEQVRDSQGACQCTFGTYLYSNGSCYPCPEYCIECINSVACSKYVEPSKRSNNGRCINTSDFDDGIKCISDFMKIPNRQNKSFAIQNNIINCPNNNLVNQNKFRLKDDALKLEFGLNSFFISFTFSLLSPSLILNETYTICFMEDNGNHVFTLIATLKKTDYFLLKLYYQQDLVITGYTASSVDTWIGTYTDLQNISLIVKTQKDPVQFYSEQVKNNPKMILKLIDPNLYVGGVISFYLDTNYPLCGSIKSNVNILKGDPTMLLFPQTLQLQSEEDMTEILDFFLSEYDKNLFLTQLTIVNNKNAQQSIQFLNYNTGFSQTSGILINKNDDANIQIPELNKKNFAIKLTYQSYYILTFDQENNFLSLVNQFNTKVISFYTLNKYRYTQNQKLRVCILQTCRTLKYVYLKVDKTNLIFIKVSVEQGLGDTFETVKLDLIINYKYEQLVIEQTGINNEFNLSTFTLNICNTNNNDPNQKIYFNILQVYLGGFFYIDYDLNDPCFLYISKINMECAIPKQGFTILDGKAIPNNQCNYGRKPTDTVLFDNYATMRCFDTKKLFPFCLEFTNFTVSICKLCTDSLMSPTQNCACPQGTYQDSDSQKCQKCSPLCLTCAGSSDNCLICKDNQQIEPECSCPLSNQYISKSDYTCQICSKQCDSCQFESNYCINCSQGRIYPPECICDNKYFENLDSESVSNDCRPITCQNKCLTCTFQSDNCTTCRGDRILPPECICPEGYFEHSSQQLEYCQSCPNTQYFDKILMKCNNCNSNCVTCFGPFDNNCQSCDGGMELDQDNRCACPAGTELILDITNNYQCYQKKNVIQYQSKQQNNLSIVIEFEDEIDNLKEIIKLKGINNLFYLRMNEIPDDCYDISQYEINKNNQLIINIIIKKSFQADQGYFYFKNTLLFRNTILKTIVDSQYQVTPFIINIGPFNLIVSGFNKSMIELMQSITPQSTDLIKFIGKLQFLFYLINSTQPTALFLMVNIQLPINFYSFLSLFGVFIFREMPEYQNNQLKSYNTLYGFDISSTSLSSSGSLCFDRLGFRNSFLFNCEIIFMKYLIIISLLVTIIILNKVFEYNLDGTNRSLSKLNFIKIFLLKRISQENEVNLMIIVFSFCIQVCNLFEDSWLSRWGFIIGLFVFGSFLSFSIWFFTIYNSNQFKHYGNNNQKEFLVHYYGRMKESQLDSSWIAKNYHFLFQLKKMILMIIIFSLVNYPFVISIVGVTLNILSAALTLYCFPYKYGIQSIIKALGDTLLAVIWIFMIIFYKFQIENQKSTILDEDKSEDYLKYGLLTSFILLGFNFIFIFNFLFETVAINIFQVFENKKKQSNYNRQISNISKSIKQVIKETNSKVQKNIKIHKYKNNREDFRLFQKNDL